MSQVGHATNPGNRQPYSFDRLYGRFLYGTWMRGKEMVRMRLKDLDIDRGQIVIRNAKGQNDRTVMLPHSLSDELKLIVQRRRIRHEQDLSVGIGLNEKVGSLQ